jgi:hypothetical protein
LNAHDRDSQLLISRDSETRHIIPAPDALRGGSIILAVRFELGCRRRRNFLPITRTSTENHVMSTIRNKDPTQMIGEVPPDAETDTNCGALSIEVFDGIRASVLVDRSQFSKDLTVPFSGAHRPLRNLQSMRDEFRVYRLQPVSRTSSIAEGCSETDFSADLRKVDMPTLIYPATTTRSCRSARWLMLRRSYIGHVVLKVFRGAP